jgi:hypothetical protein
MKSPKSVADQIFEIEGFEVRFFAWDGSAPRECYLA